MPYVQNITVTFTQGQDVIQKTIYVSGNAKSVLSFDSLYSGLQSGVDFGAVVSGMQSLCVNSDVGNQRVKFYGLSGDVQFDLNANNPLVWWSGNGFTNPLANCSGNVIGMSVQQLSGFASGTISVQLMKDATP